MLWLKKMFGKLNAPAFPNSRFNLNSFFNLFLTFFVFVIGVYYYRKGYTYEGTILWILVTSICFCYPYYAKIFSHLMTGMVFAVLVPPAIWIQNKCVEVGIWEYLPNHPYLLGWITKTGDGWKNWTQILWLGNDMPLMEYIFYPTFCFFNMTLYCLFIHLLPDRPFEKISKHLDKFYYLCLGSVFLYLLLPLFVPNRNNIDYGYILGLIGQPIVIFTFFLSPRFRLWLKTPAALIWWICITFLFCPAWEYLHCVINQDWVYNISKTTPAAYCIGDNCIPLYEVLGYLTVPFVFQGLFYNAIRIFGKVALKDRNAFPFGNL